MLSPKLVLFDLNETLSDLELLRWPSSYPRFTLAPARQRLRVEM
jgi:hypothetical protein